MVRLLLGAITAMPLLLLTAPTAHAAEKAPTAGLALREIVPATTDEPLMNPGMGIYLFGKLKPGDMPPDAWFDKMITIGYFRDDWSVLQPDGDGTEKFAEYFEPIFDEWVKKRGKRVAFRIMSQNMHSQRQYTTPKWVFDRGVPGLKFKGIYVPEQIDPVFWDERYLAIQEKFIADLGKYLDGRPGLEFVDIGCIGEWGEMHLSRWTAAHLEQSGYTEQKYIAAYRRIIDAFARAFPNTRVFLNVGDYETLNDYAAIRGQHFRQDGLNPSGPSANVGKRFYHPYSRRGVMCNYELHSGYQAMKQRGWDVRKTFDKGLEDPISYMHINLMSYQELLKAPDEVKEVVTKAAQRVGYRFELSRLRCNQTLNLDGQTPGRLLLDHTWKNTGVAPCYDSYALHWTLLDADGKLIAETLSYPKRPTTVWWPGEEVTLRSMITVPKDTAPGSYRLKLAMVKPEEPALRIQLGIAGRDATGAYQVAEIPVARVAPRQLTVFQEGFEKDTAGWGAAPGMAVRVDTDAQAGKGGLLVEGAQPGNSWNYASMDLKVPLLPASRYRLSYWMKVDQIAPKKEPYLKLGLVDQAGKWLTNCGTAKYDLSRLGTWQHLEGTLETTAETAGGHLAIEKGDEHTAVKATIRLDEVKLELLESP